jgi:hypothetical protein
MSRLNLSSVFLAVLGVCALSAVPAQAAPILLAKAQMSATASDLSGLTGNLENGQAANLLGGLGSGLAWAGGNTFLALPDRGPNAVTYNTAVDNTTSYIPRFHTLTMTLSTGTGSLPMDLSVALTGTKLLYSPKPLVYGAVIGSGAPSINDATHYYFSGRSDNFSSGQNSLYSANARFDPEGIRLAPSGKTLYISDEYGPYIYQFDRATGARGRAYVLPSIFGISTLSAVGATEISGNTTGRVANKGMEGLAISPDGKTLFGFMQSPLAQDGGDGGRANRIISIDLATGATKQYAYDNYLADKNKNYNSSEVLALNNHELLVLERDGKGLGDDSTAVLKRIYKIDLAGATDVSNLTGETALKNAAPTKSLFLDILTTLTSAGITAANVPAKLEGMAFGNDVTYNGTTYHTLYVANDNDFVATTTAGNKSNPNQWFVFGFTDADLGGSTFVNQSFK